MEYNHTTYILCTNVSNELVNVNNISFRNDVADMPPTRKDIIIDVKIYTNSIIHCICILPKFQRKGFGALIMGKLSQSDTKLDGNVDAVTR